MTEQLPPFGNYSWEGKGGRSKRGVKRSSVLPVLAASLLFVATACSGHSSKQASSNPASRDVLTAPAIAQGPSVGKAPPDVEGVPASPAAKASHSKGVGKQAKLKHRKVCPRAKATRIECTSKVATDKKGTPLTFPKPDDYSLPGIYGTVWAFGPKDYHVAYGLPWSAKVQQTIGIVLWADDPTAKKDLDAFDTAFGLGSFPTCTSLSTWAPCFAKVNQRGSTSGFPPVSAEVSLEASLDVQYTHAMCLNCRIILIEADSYSYVDPETGETHWTATGANLAAAENMAYRLGATEINNSWGAPEIDDSTGAFNCQAELNSGAFNHPGVAIVASSGDGGYGANCPADLNTVVAVGGTDLSENSDFSYLSETVYYVEDFFGNGSGPGSGCSALIGARTFQASTGNWSRTGCGSKRGITDVSASYGGAWVYDSTAGYNSESTGNYWYVVYGTSLAAPIISATYALAGNAWSVSYPAQFAYQHPASFHDVTSGSNGYCTTIMCQATPGYDGPTGMGSPYGLGGF